MTVSSSNFGFEACPSGWARQESSCYYIGKTRFLKWHDARSTCQNMGGDLAIIKSAEENGFIFNLMKNAQVTGYGAWIGLYQKPDTSFYWLDGTPITAGYSAWSRGEPNNVYPKGPINCVRMQTWDKGRWDDFHCELASCYRNKAPVAVCQKTTINPDLQGRL